jgi:hypothetical protein
MQIEFGAVVGIVSVVLALGGIWYAIRSTKETRERDNLDKRASEAGTSKFVWREGKPVGLIHERTAENHLDLTSSTSQNK